MIWDKRNCEFGRRFGINDKERMNMCNSRGRSRLNDEIGRNKGVRISMKKGWFDSWVVLSWL